LEQKPRPIDRDSILISAAHADRPARACLMTRMPSWKDLVERVVGAVSEANVAAPVVP
jgi:hypothetical protein